ncbi:hypothetical protein [Thalassospira sp.]|uniref:hypothetical protein n=1 Tax=Thalassospira sp. TaxID=1912094 RepID=UPI0031200E77
MTAFARLFIDAVFALEESVTDFWHPVYAILYTRDAFCSATNPPVSVFLKIAEISHSTFAMQYQNPAQQHRKGFD